MAISTELENAKNLLKSNEDYLISKLNQYGSYLSKDNYHYNCFRCGSKDNLSIEESNGNYFITCFSINKGSCDVKKWDIINLVMQMENISFNEAIKMLCNEFGISLEVNTNSKSNTTPKAPKKEVVEKEDINQEKDKPEAELQIEDKPKEKQDNANFILQAHKNVDKTDYFHNRGFSAELIDKYNLGYIPNYSFMSKNGNNVKVGDVAVIPYPGENYYIMRLVNPPKNFNKYKKLPGKEPLFNLKKLSKGNEPIFITEGQFDCLSLIEVGANAIGLNGVGGVNKLLKALQGKQVHRPFIIALDDDEAGEGAKKVLEKGLNDLNVYYYIFKLPKDIEGVKDPNDLLVKDKNKLVELVDAATDEALKEFKEFKMAQDVNKIYGDYTYSKDSNVLFKVIERETKDGPKTDFIPIYDGDLRITGTSIDIDTDIENVILKSKMTFEAESQKEVEKGILFGATSKFTEALNNKKGFRIKPDKRTQVFIQNYLYDQYAGLEKDSYLKEKYITSKLGFVKNNNQNTKIDTFVYPDSQITLGDNVYYREDGIYNNIFKSNGTTKEWIENILKPSLASDNMKVMLLGTFASILIEPLGAHENFIIELSGNTGTSKTTALNVCASVFGEPTKYITDWRTTSTAAISKASEINVFPLMLDDTKKCDDKKIISSLVYSLSSGRDKARSDVTGKAREVKTFKNITLTCGEVPLHDYLTEGRGALSRFIALEGGALEKSNANKLIADQLNINTHKYYGTIGFEFVKWLVKKLKDNDFMSMTNDLYLTYMQQLPLRANNEMAQRRCNHVALLKITGYVLEDFFGQDYFDYENLIDNLVKEINQNSKEVDVIEAAYVGVMEYCTKNSFSFYKNQDADDNGEIHERPNIVGQFKEGLYMFYDKTDLVKILEEYGDATDILRNFRDRNYLITNKGASQFAKTVKKLTDKKPKKMYVVNPGPYQEAIEKEKELEEQNKDVTENFIEVEQVKLEEIPF